MKQYRWIFLAIFILTILAAVSANVMAQDESKGGFSFNFGGMPAMDSKLEIDFSKIFLGTDLPREVFDVKLPGLIFGGNFRVNLFREKPLYVGGNLLFTKPKNNFVIFQDTLLPTSLWVYFLDFNVGAELKKLSVKRKFVPYVEGGAGLLGVYRVVSISVDFYNRWRLSAGGQKDFSKHFSFGARSYMGEDGKYFMGGKASFYRSAENPVKMFLGEVGLVF